MLVVDTSAVLDVLVAEPPDPRLTERLRADGDLHAPHLIDVELVHALRRLVHRDVLGARRADRARGDFRDLALVRYPHVDLVERMWELRDKLTAYDAAFIALGEALAVPLVTVDGRLGAAPGHRAQVEVF